MKIINETDDEPIYEAQNGCGSCGPIDPPLRMLWANWNPHGLNPFKVLDGPDVRGYAGKLAQAGNDGDTHSLPDLTHHNITIVCFMNVNDDDDQHIAYKSGASRLRRYALVKQGDGYEIVDRGLEE